MQNGNKIEQIHPAENETLKPKNALLKQFFRFFLVALLAGAFETGSYVLLVLVLKKYDSSVMFLGREFLFSAFVAYLVSAFIGQLVSFLVNRKKTFDANNDIRFALFIFILWVITKIILQSLFGPVLNSAFTEIADRHFEEGTLIYTLIADMLGKLIMMIITMFLSFIVNKFAMNRHIEKE